MTRGYPVSPAPGPLEDHAECRRQRPTPLFRRYLEGLLLPAERNKTLTALANTEPVGGAQRKETQSLKSGSFRNQGGTPRGLTYGGWSWCAKPHERLPPKMACWS